MKDKLVFFMASLVLLGAGKATNASNDNVSQQIQLSNTQVHIQIK